MKLRWFWLWPQAGPEQAQAGGEQKGPKAADRAPAQAPAQAPATDRSTEVFDMWLSTLEASGVAAEEVANRLRVNVRAGLLWREAEQRRSFTGLNELTVLQEDPTWKKYIEQVTASKPPLYRLTLPVTAPSIWREI